MLKETIKMSVKEDMDVRPIALLVQEASKYDSEVHILCGNKKVNAKSIMGMMGLALENGQEVELQVSGNDEEQALAGMKSFFGKA